MTGKVINLRQTRKKLVKVAKRKVADANSATFGTPKDVRDLNLARAKKAARDLDGHKRDD
ncbi:MAG: DUF4169 family protein [Rhodobacteraceae bacterium]|nr:DUF4169 family protein [Paracoccaceae bacterium]